MNARLIKAAAQENAASVALNHQEQPHFSALSPPQSDGKRLSPSAKAALHGNRADTLTRPNSKRPTHRRRKREKSRRGKSKSAAAPFPAPHSRNRRADALQTPFGEKRPRQSRQMRNRAAGFQRPLTACGERSGPHRRQKREKSRRGNPSPQRPLFLLPTAESAGRMRFKRLSGKNAKRAAAENPSPQQPLFLLPTAETAGRMRFKRLSGKNARARVGRCETAQPVFSARLPRAARRGRAKRPYNTDENAKRAAAENPSPQRPIFLHPTAETAG